MNCTDCTDALHDYVDGELAPAAAHAVETHVCECARCRAQLESLRALLGRVRSLPGEIPPREELWPELSRQLAGNATRGLVPTGPAAPRLRSTVRPSGPVHGALFFRWVVPLAIAASVMFLATLAERNITPHAAWSVSAVAGAPRIGTKPVGGEARFQLGQWLETDSQSRARVAVGSIGEVNVQPNSRLRLVGVAATDHRLELARGTMDAFIWAPPRLFFVDTPSATAVDLGCAYTLTVDAEGNGELQVSTGYVALEDGDRESIVRSGMRCLTRRGMGPGTPFADDAPEALRTALTRFDFERGAAVSALPQVLAHAGADDTVTLWHLLARTKGAQRAAVFDLLAQHAPPPAAVTRDGILAGSAAMRRAWAEALGLERL